MISVCNITRNTPWCTVYQLTTSRHCESGCCRSPGFKINPGRPSNRFVRKWAASNPVADHQFPPLQWSGGDPIFRGTHFEMDYFAAVMMETQNPIKPNSIHWWILVTRIKIAKKNATDSGYTSCANEHISKSCW